MKNKIPPCLRNWLNLDNIISIIIVFVVLGVLAIPHLDMKIIDRLLICEGILLLCIFFLYTHEKRKNKAHAKDREKALRMQESRVAAIEAAGDAIAIVDEDGCLVFMNTALMELFAIEPDRKNEYLNHSWLNLFNENGRMDLEDNILPLLEENPYWQGISPFSRHDGKVVRAEFSLTKLPDGGLIGTARDISEIEQFGKEKQQLEAQLYQAQKMEAIGRLAGGIAHDFNNILAAMNGYAEFLKEDLPEGSSEQQFAVNILKAGRQARDLVDQMLAFSRQKQSAHQQLDMRKILNEAHAMLRASLPKTMELITNFQAEENLVEGNESQVAQMIMNLCVNARDAMGDDHGTLSLASENVRPVDKGWEAKYMQDGFVDPAQTPPMVIEEISHSATRLFLGSIANDHDYICLSVGDTGTGMSSVIMENIFEPFFTTKPVDKGTGLGLSTVLGVIAAHHGALLVESELGKGTIFKIFFPVSTGAAQADVSEQGKSPQGFIPAKILFVEDQEEVRSVIERSLLRYGYDVDCCENGIEALAVLQDCPDEYDLVVTDHNMPKMSGLELINRVHMDYPDIAFVVLSGYSQEKLREMMAEHEAVKAILRKPVSKEILHETIQAVLPQLKKKAA